VSNGSIVIAMRNEIDMLRKELAKSRDLIGRMQDREKQLRERFDAGFTNDLCMVALFCLNSVLCLHYLTDLQVCNAILNS
jgi:hypothetical protein